LPEFKAKKREIHDAEEEIKKASSIVKNLNDLVFENEQSLLIL